MPVATVQNKVEMARMFAVHKHGSRRRSLDGAQTIAHLENVVAILKDHGHDAQDLLASAYLHDCLEDTDTTLQHLIVRFGNPIAELVFWLTDTYDGNRMSNALKSAWRLSRAPWDAKLIQMADIVDNCRSIRLYDQAFAASYLDEKRQVLRLMAEREGPALMQLSLFQRAVAVTDLAER
ncbi:HD domain-containing protein [Hyphomicrobium sp.]|uniref:HD domain-containing protein n=1 Tax=Hyphomicrobium sp. TaxID=82 RepID=UPI0025C428FF|nr:HD domain-containing protein [Hyphomicrobium sp.]